MPEAYFTQRGEEVKIIFMKYIQLKSSAGIVIRFNLYEQEAPFTCKAFIQSLPFELKAVQARFAGEEIWMPEGPSLDIPQENATIELKLGELGYAPPLARNSVSHSVALVYGEAKLSDCVNVFAKVFDEDVSELKKLGEQIWLEGSQVLRFELISDN